MALQAGTRVGAYEIVALIGAGGMGEVYRASDPRLKRDVAIKVLPPGFAKDPERMRRFELEAQAAGRLNHPNVLGIYDIGLHDESPYLVSELLEGESLRARVRAGKLPVQRAVDYARQIACGLAAAHAAGIVHRDLKPENVFVTKDGRVKILDFGLAKMALAAAASQETCASSTIPGTVMGTVGYMSPEQIRGHAVDSRSDIFSFGCVLHEMLTGQQPFKGESSADTISAILNADRPELNVAAGLSPALDRIVGHCLEKQPHERFQSAQDLAFDLAAISGLSQTSRLPAAAAAAAPGRKWLAFAAIALVALAVFAGAFLIGRLSAPHPQPKFERLTFRRGTLGAARFAPDGNTVVYSAAWEDEPGDLYAVRLGSPESRPLGVARASLLALSRSGELAVVLNPTLSRAPIGTQGLLARVSFSGGSPRAIDDRITFADWSANGQDMVVTRETDAGFQLEYPAGKVLYRTAGFISCPRLSPSGELIAFIDHAIGTDTAGSVAIVDRAGKVKTLTERFASAGRLTWTPRGDEIWFSAAPSGALHELRAVTPAKRQRLVYRQSSSIAIHDIASDGRVLLEAQSWRQRMVGRAPGDTRDRELSWLDWPLPTDISVDGKFVVFSETGEGAGAEPALYLRETSGAPAVKLGPGTIAQFSPDGRFVVTMVPGGDEILVYPTGPGQPRHVPVRGFDLLQANLLADGKRICFYGNERGKETRLYLTSLDGEKPRPITSEGTVLYPPFVTRDGKYYIARVAGKRALVPFAGGDPEPLLGVDDGDRTTGWALDSQSFYVYRRADTPTKLYKVDRRTGRRTFMQDIGPSERAGVGTRGVNANVTPDGKAYVYSVEQNLSELYLVTGLK